MISQTVRNWSLGFGRQVGIQVSYKILRLAVQRRKPSLQIELLALKRGYFEIVLMKSTLRTLGVKTFFTMLGMQVLMRFVSEHT